MTADTEDNYVIAQANTPVDENGFLKEKRVAGRKRAEIIEMDATEPTIWTFPRKWWFPLPLQ